MGLPHPRLLSESSLMRPLVLFERLLLCRLHRMCLLRDGGQKQNY